MDESTAGKTNFNNQEKKLTSEIVPFVLGKETFNNLSSFVGTVTYCFNCTHSQRHVYKSLFTLRSQVSFHLMKETHGL